MHLHGRGVILRHASIEDQRSGSNPQSGDGREAEVLQTAAEPAADNAKRPHRPAAAQPDLPNLQTLRKRDNPPPRLQVRHQQDLLDPAAV